MSYETDTAWMAGLFEGEGCISFMAKNAVQLVLSMTDRDVVDRLQEVAGCGTVVSRQRDGIQEAFVWTATNKADVTRVLWRILPWLGDRRGLKALQALERLAFARDQGTRDVCGRGHLKAGDNLYEWVNAKGEVTWQCKECRRATARRRYQLKEASIA